jgi:hypothetical protein
LFITYMDATLFKKLHYLVNKGFFNDKDIQEFGPTQTLDELDQHRLYFISIIKHDDNKIIDSIVQYNNTYFDKTPNIDPFFDGIHENMPLNEVLTFRQYYVRTSMIDELPSYNKLQKTDRIINIPIYPEFSIVDISDIIHSHYFY